MVRVWISSPGPWRGAVATSGLRSRIWWQPDGAVAHHLLDPATGAPAFSGLIAVTALADTAVRAEALAKQALLLGPSGARDVLSDRGGIAVTEAGEARRYGAVEPRPIVRLRLPDGVQLKGIQ